MQDWTVTIVGGTIAAVVAGVILYKLLPSQQSPQVPPTKSLDVVGTERCWQSDGSPGLIGTRDGRAFCFRTTPKR